MLPGFDNVQFRTMIATFRRNAASIRLEGTGVQVVLSTWIYFFQLSSLVGIVPQLRRVIADFSARNLCFSLMCVVSGQSGTEALFRRVSKGAEKRLSALSCLFVLMQHPNSHRMHLRSVSYLGFFLKNSDIFRYSLNSEGNRHSIETYIRMRFIKYLAVIDFYTYNLDKTCSLECTS